MFSSRGLIICQDSPVFFKGSRSVDDLPGEGCWRQFPSGPITFPVVSAYTQQVQENKMIYEPLASSDLDYPKRRSERHHVCLQGCNVELEYWAGTTLGVAYRAPLCLSSCVGKLTAPVLKLAVNYRNNRNARAPSRHLGKWVPALVTCSSLFLASPGVCWALS